MIENILKEKLCNFTNSIKISLENKNWYAALSLTLTIPDICGRLEHPDKSSTKRYILWCNKYLIEKYTMKNRWVTHVFLSGEDAYALRCAYLHQGEINIEDQRVRKALTEFLFVEPPERGSSHCFQNNNKLLLQVDVFCLDVCEAIERWIENVSDDEKIQNRAKKLMTIHPIGKSFSF